VDDHGVADERGYYFQSVGLFTSDAKKGVQDQRDAIRGREARADGKPYTFEGNVGFFGYYAGPDVHILDGFALADPLLARLPIRSVTWRIGHFVRQIPAGYPETLTFQENRIQDANIAAYYDRLSLITRGDIFGTKRWSAIWQMNTGQYKGYLEPLFASRRYQNIGVRFFERQKPGEAIVNLQKSVSLDSTRSAAWATLARAYHMVGRLEGARTAMINAAQLDPERYASDLRSLAIYHDRNGELEKAITLYKELLELIPPSVQARVELGSLYERAGRFDEAIEEYEQGLALTPDDDDIQTRIEALRRRSQTR
jgi:tetratricopeptide (TPR) repeat protein